MSATTCYIHPEKAANTACEKCHRPICPADHRTIQQGFAMAIMCPDCYNKAKRNRNIGVIIVVIVALALAGAFYYIIRSQL